MSDFYDEIMASINETMDAAKKNEIEVLVDMAITSFAEGLLIRYQQEVDDETGVINMKKNNCFIAELGEEFMFYSAFVRSFDSSFGNVLEKMGTKNLIILFQLYVKYSNELDNRDVAAPAGCRSFTFLKHERLAVHNEQPEEAAKRKSIVKPETAKIVREKLLENMKRLLKNRLGKVYIDPDMARYALPLQEATAQGGFGVLTKGSRLPVDMSKKVRGFTYWEKVNDIDLSVIGLDNEGKQYEFSWRTMAGNQSEAITYIRATRPAAITAARSFSISM